MCKITKTANALNMKYAGETTMYCRHIKYDTIKSIFGSWIKHEFGGECFVPFRLIESPYKNTSCFST